MLWSPLTTADAWDFQGNEALYGQVFAVQSDERLEIPEKTRCRENGGVAEAPNGSCAMRSQNDERHTPFAASRTSPLGRFGVAFSSRIMFVLYASTPGWP